MAKGQQPTKADPPKGRMVVIAAAVIGVGAILGYGAAQMQSGKEATKEAKAAVDEKAAPEPSASPTAPQLLARAQNARRSLDVPALQALERELSTAAQAAPAAPEAPILHGEQISVLMSLALESRLRAWLDRTGASALAEQSGIYANQAMASVEKLGAALDPSVVLAARARQALCAGEDVAARHPSVLHPAFPDRELRYAVMARPLWDRQGPSAEAFDDAARANLATELERLPDPSTVEHLLFALALPEGDPRAPSIVGEVLAAAPANPLAKAIQSHLRAQAQVAVADPPPADPTPPTNVDPEPTDPEPTDPEPSQPADPEPSQPTDAEPSQPAETDPVKKSAQPKQPKPKAPATDLAEEGCSLVQGGKAEQGYALLEKAFDKNPKDTKVILCMAEGHMKLGRLPSARNMVERVLRSSPKNKKALLLAAKIEDKLGNQRSAADYYSKVLELEPDNATAKSYVEKHG